MASTCGQRAAVTGGIYFDLVWMLLLRGSTRVNLGATSPVFTCQMESVKTILFYHLTLRVPACVVSAV